MTSNSEVIHDPCVVIISCASDRPEKIVKLILNNDNPEHDENAEGMRIYKWHIDNKYYTADINLIALPCKTISSQAFAESVEAVVVLFDSRETTALEVVDSWMPFVNTFAPDIKLLVCENCTDEEHSITKLAAQQWCISKGFELVELNPIIDTDEDDEYEDDFPESTGVKRIIQALNAHVWPNLTMKSENHSGSSVMNGLKLENLVLDDRSEEQAPQGINVNSLEASLEELLENEDNFSDLFSKLHEMKARISECTGEERKDAAEQVVKAFWRALGGDEEEILDE